MNDGDIERRAGMVRAQLTALAANFGLLVLLFFSGFALHSPLLKGGMELQVR